jgi:metallopeptidase MepB
MSSNSFVPPCKPLRFDSTPYSLEQGAKDLIEERALLVNQLVQSYNPENAFVEGVIPFIRYENTFIRKRRFITYHSGEAAQAELRDAARNASKLFNQADIELFGRKDFFELIKTARGSAKDLDPEFDHYLEILTELFEENGLTITDPEKFAQFKDLKVKIGNLQSDIIKKINDDASGSWYTREDLEGLPESYLESHTLSRDDNGSSFANIWVSTKESDTAAFFQRAIKSDIRKAHYIVTQNRGQDNIPMYRELFLLRDQAAKLLGYDNHAAFRTNYQTMKNPQRVLDFLDGVESKMKPKANEYIADLLKLKNEHIKSTGQKNDHPDYVFHWDTSFYGRLLKERVCEYDDNLVTEYFSLEYSIKQLFKFFEHLFGVLIKEWTPEEQEVFHENVSMYTLWDKDNDNAFIGWLYIDPYPRPGKYNHFSHFGLQPVREHTLHHQFHH